MKCEDSFTLIRSVLALDMFSVTRASGAVADSGYVSEKVAKLVTGGSQILGTCPAAVGQRRPKALEFSFLHTWVTVTIVKKKEKWLLGTRTQPALGCSAWRGAEVASPSVCFGPAGSEDRPSFLPPSLGFAQDCPHRRKGGQSGRGGWWWHGVSGTCGCLLELIC